MIKHNSILYKETNYLSLWRYIFAAGIPTLIIGVLLISLDLELREKANNIEKSAHRLDLITRLQDLSILGQKIRGMEQLFPIAILNTDKVSDRTNQPHNTQIEKEDAGSFQSQLPVLRNEYLDLVNQLLHEDLGLTNFSKQRLEEVYREGQALFQAKIVLPDLAMRFDAYTRIIGRIHEITIHQSENYNHLLNSHENCRNLVNLYALNLPELMESVGRLRGFGSGVITKGVISRTARNEWYAMTGGISKAYEYFEYVINFLINNDKSNADALKVLRDDIDNHVKQYITYTSNVINDIHIVTPQEYFRIGTEVIENLISESGKLNYMLLSMQSDKAHVLATYRTYVQLGGVLGVTVLLYFIVTFFHVNKSSFCKLGKVNYVLEKSQEQLRQIIDLVPHMIVARKADGSLLLANREFLRTFNMTDIDSKPVIGTTEEAARSYERLFGNDKKVLASESSYHQVEDNFIDAEGRHRFLLTTKIPFDTNYVDTPAVLTVCVDFTEQVKIREMQQVAGIGYWEWDLESNRLNLSTQFCKTIGLESEEFPGTVESYLDLVVLEDRNRVKQAFESAQCYNKTISLEHRIISKNGIQRDLMLQSKIFKKRYEKTNLLVGTVQDITSQKEARQKLQDSENNLRELAGYLLDIREEERSNIARNLHDELGGYLMALKMDISLLNKRFFAEDDKITNQLSSMSQLVDRSVVSMRKIITNLRPSILDELGLIEALEWQLKEFGQRYSIKVSFQGQNSKRKPKFKDSECEINIFRIYQEMLNNILKHAKANNVSVTAAVIQQKFTLSVADDGCGIRNEQLYKSGSYGILGMQERINRMKGKLTITGGVNKGTVFTLRIPLSSYIVEKSQLFVH